MNLTFYAIWVIAIVTAGRERRCANASSSPALRPAFHRLECRLSLLSRGESLTTSRSKLRGIYDPAKHSTACLRPRSRACADREGRGEPAVSPGCFLRRTFAMNSARTSRCEVRAAAPQAPAAPPHAFFPWRNPALAGGRSAVPGAVPPPAGEVAARSADGGVSNLSRGQAPLHHAASRRGPQRGRIRRGRLFVPLDCVNCVNTVSTARLLVRPFQGRIGKRLSHTPDRIK